MDELKTYYVYQYLRQNTSANGPAGSPYYVGKGTGRRAYGLHGRMPVPKDRERIVFVAENMNEADALQLEMLLISLHGRKDIGTGILRNLSDGGEGNSGLIHSDAAKAKMSKARKGRKMPPRTPEHRAKLSLAHTGKTGEMSSRFGKKHSPETIAKMAERTFSPETKVKMSEAAIRRWAQKKAA